MILLNIVIVRHTPDALFFVHRIVRHTPVFVFVHRIVRHTPAFGHPSPRGDGAAAQHLPIIDDQNDASAHPLLERGGRRPGCVAPSSHRKGVSHRQAIAKVLHYQAIAKVCCTVKPLQRCVAPSSRKSQNAGLFLTFSPSSAVCVPHFRGCARRESRRARPYCISVR